ncbi:MAG: ATP-binding protein [Candidatus Acidiferrales bacterium]
MDTEHSRTEMKLSRDERLLAGVRGAVEHIANRHGLTADESIDLAFAAGQACRKVLVHLDELGALCIVTIDDFEDRVEVSVEDPRSSEPAKLNSFAEDSFTVPAEREAEIKKRVDRVDYDTSNGRARTILVKYFHKNPAHS